MGKDQDFLEAARNGNLTLIEKILSQKAKRSGPLASLRRGPGINVQDNGGYSALHYAALNGHTDIVRLLLYHEASPNILDSRGSSPLHLAAWAGHQEIVKMLLTHPYKPANPDMQTMENETPLHCAAQHGHTGALTTLLAHRANPNVRNSRNETPLDLAAQYGRLQAVQMLIRAHPELLQTYSVEPKPFPASTSFDGKPHPNVVTHSALHLASRNGHNNVVEILLAAGVNVNLLTPSGTALHEAALCGKDVVVRTLLEAGANLSATDSEGRTALDILQEFPPHVTKGIISVINTFRTRFDDDLDSTCSLDKTDKRSNRNSGEFAVGCSKDAISRDELKCHNDIAVSPSVSVNSFEQSMMPMPGSQASNGNAPEFYVKMAPIKIHRSVPKKPPRRNLSISPTHIQNFFPPTSDLVSTGIEFCENEKAISEYESLKQQQQQTIANQSSYEYICMARTGPAIHNSNENLVSLNKAASTPNDTWYVEMAPPADEKPVPAPRKLKNPPHSYENSTLKSYNPNRKLKRNRENYFAKGQFSLTISSDTQESPNPPPSRDEKAGVHHIRRPLSQEYTYNPDYLGVDCGSSPQDHHTLCLSLCNSSGSISSGVSLSDRSVSTDCVEEYVGDEPFAGLFKGSTMNLNNENSNNPNNRYYIPNDCLQSGGLLPRNLSGEKNKNTSTTDSQSESSEEALNNGTTSRKYKKDKRSIDDSKRTTKDTRIHKLSLLSDNTDSCLETISNPCVTSSSPIVASIESNNSIEPDSGARILSSFNEKDAWQKLSEIMETFGNTILNSESNSNGLSSFADLDEMDPCEDHKRLAKLLDQNGLGHLARTLYLNGYDSYRFMHGIFDARDLSVMNISDTDASKLLEFTKTLPCAKFTPLVIESSLDNWLKSIQLIEYSDNFKKHLYNTFKSVCGVWEIELQTVLEINKIGHRKRILHSIAAFRDTIDDNKSSENVSNNKKCEVTAPQNPKGTLRSNKKNRPAPKPPLNSLEIRAPSELLIGLPSNLHIKWPHSANSLVSNFLKYEVYYLGSTVVKELRGTESTRKSIQKLKRVGRSSSSNSSSKLDINNCKQENRLLVQLSISYRGVEFFDIKTNETICEHEIRNINCACQDADDMSHFAYITKDNELNTHYCHVFHVDSMHLAMEIILTLAESFEVAYQMALRNSSPLSKTKDSSKISD